LENQSWIGQRFRFIAQYNQEYIVFSTFPSQPAINNAIFFIHCFQSPAVQAAAAEALAVMSESLSSRDKIGKLGMCHVSLLQGEMARWGDFHQKRNQDFDSKK
jgi:hypothetical protein